MAFADQACHEDSDVGMPRFHIVIIQGFATPQAAKPSGPHASTAGFLAECFAKRCVVCIQLGVGAPHRAPGLVSKSR